MKKIILFTSLVLVILGSLAIFLLNKSKPEVVENNNFKKEAKLLEVNQPKVFIEALDGSADLIRGAQISVLQVGQELQISDKIKTKSESRVTINFYNSAISYVDADAELEITDLKLDQKNNENSNINLTVMLGRIWSRVKSLVDREASFEINSDSTVATVRGTTFDFIVLADKTTEVKVIDSVVEVAAMDLDQPKLHKKLKTILVNPGKKIKISHDLIKQLKKDSKVEFKIEDLNADEQIDKWFKKNKSDDEFYDKKYKLRDLKKAEKLEDKNINLLGESVKSEAPAIIKPKTNIVQPVVEPVIIKPTQPLPVIEPAEPQVITKPVIVEPLPEPVIIKELVGLVIIIERPNLLAGQGVQARAIAKYSDQTTKDVTNIASWSMDGDLGSVSSAGYIQSTSAGGKGLIRASYTEDGKIVSSNIIEVTALSIAM